MSDHNLAQDTFKSGAQNIFKSPESQRHQKLQNTPSESPKRHFLQIEKIRVKRSQGSNDINIQFGIWSTSESASLTEKPMNTTKGSFEGFCLRKTKQTQ